MIGVLVMAGDSLLADAIVSHLAQDAAIQVRRLAIQDVDQISQRLHEDYSVVILVEEGRSNEGSMTPSDLLQGDRCLRIITVSAQKHHLHIYDGYEIPISGMAQVVHLAKGFTQEHLSEVSK